MIPFITPCTYCHAGAFHPRRTIYTLCLAVPKNKQQLVNTSIKSFFGNGFFCMEVFIPEKYEPEGELLRVAEEKVGIGNDTPRPVNNPDCMSFLLCYSCVLDSGAPKKRSRKRMTAGTLPPTVAVHHPPVGGKINDCLEEVDEVYG